MHEQLARLEANDLVRRNTAIRTADPEIGRGLLALQPLKEPGIGRDPPLSPVPVVFLQMLQHFDTSCPRSRLIWPASEGQARTLRDHCRRSAGGLAGCRRSCYLPSGALS